MIFMKASLLDFAKNDRPLSCDNSSLDVRPKAWMGTTWIDISCYDFFCPEVKAVFLKSMARIFMIILDSVCRFWPGKYQKAARKHPDAATMQRYFSKARQISGQDWMHRLIMVPCSASGSMTLEDGAKRAGK